MAVRWGADGKLEWRSMLATFWGPFKSRVDAVSESVKVRDVIDRLDALIVEPLFQVRHSVPHGDPDKLPSPPSTDFH